MARFGYPIVLTADDNGTFLVTCPDLPEVTTFGEDESEAVLRATDAIEEAIAARIAAREDIPLPSAARGRKIIVLPPQIIATAMLYRAMREQGVKKAELARRLSAKGPQVDRLLDIRHASRLDRIDAAFAALGKRMVIDVENAP